MALGGPSVAPSTRSWLGVARELTAGTPVSPTNTIPMDAKSYSPEDTPKFLPDEAIRGSMALLYEDIIGPADATFSFGGPAFLDTHGFFLDSAFGDLSTTGTVSAGTSTAFSGSPAVGATVATVGNGTTFTVGQTVQFDSGSIAEVVTLTATASTSIGFGNNPLRFAHGASGTVFTVVAPFTHTFALLNSQLGYGGVPGAQPPTLTLTDNTNLNYGGTPGTNTAGARAYPSSCVSAVDISGNVEQLLDFKVTGNSWVSIPAAVTPTNTISNIIPQANWKSSLYIGGTAAANLITTNGEWAVNIKRQLQVYWTSQGTISPFIIARGPLSAMLSMKFTAPADETPLSYMLYQGPLWVHIVLNSGNTGGTSLSMTIDANTVQFTKSKPGRSAVLMDFDNTGECIANTTNVGGTGGLGPVTVKLVNQIPTY